MFLGTKKAVPLQARPLFMRVTFRNYIFLPYNLPVVGALFVMMLSFPVAAQGQLSEEALADLIKPGVVRIAEHVTGTAKIPAVKVDIRKRLVTVIPDRFTEVNIDEYLSGSGFVIHPRRLYCHQCPCGFTGDDQDGPGVR